MPYVDMRRALTNPRSLDTFTVIRRAQNTVKGRVTMNLIPYVGIRGVVTPDPSQKDLLRLSDEQLQGKVIIVVTQFALRGETEDSGKQEFQPDLVQWHGNNFIVFSSDDFSSFGAGFIRAICVMTDIQAVPPVTQAVVAPVQPVTPPAVPVVTGTKHYPLELTDGVRTTFTFPGLPATGNYALYWNGLLQDFYTQAGETITLNEPPEIGADLYTEGY